MMDSFESAGYLRGYEHGAYPKNVNPEQARELLEVLHEYGFRRLIGSCITVEPETVDAMVGYIDSTNRIPNLHTRTIAGPLRLMGKSIKVTLLGCGV